jgi:hypothetical protein
MNPSVKDRLGSVVRALNGVVLPALPKEASLAQEQVMLAMGHIQIILAQMDAAPAFLAEEADDLEQMGAAVAAAADGGTETAAAKAALGMRLANTEAAAPEARTQSAQDAIDVLLLALAKDGDPGARTAVRDIVLTQGAARAEKDRRWFAAMGFDIDYSGG